MKIRANAKINFSLGICGKREDGYHLIDTVMHSIDLFDEIEIEKANETVVICYNNEIPQNDNIAFTAANLFFEECNISDGAEIKIIKNIPAAAGLGGGSADAAAVLLGLDRLYKTDLSTEKLCDMAVRLGADVPFFIKGGCARAQGIGEILTECKPLEKGYILLAKSDKKTSTKEMYRLIDQKQTVLPDTDRVISAISRNDLEKLSDNLYNAFESVWKENGLKQKLLEFSPLAVALTGSGPTFFALFEDYKQAKLTEDMLKREDITCFVTTPQKNAVIFE